MAVLRVERAQLWLGTVIVIRAEVAAWHAEAALEEAFDAIAAVHREMSFHDGASALSGLNRAMAGESQAVGDALWRVLNASVLLARHSAGRFDPTVAGHLVDSGHLPRPAGRSPDPSANWRDIGLLPGRRVVLRRAVWIDLGGIAKGYAVDRAVAALRRHGVKAGVVNAGGDLRVFGEAPETIRVRDPRDPSLTHVLAQVRDGAAATSAGYFSRLDGRSALLDPVTGLCSDAGRSVTVCAPRAVWADALTKVVLADPDGALPLLRKLHASAAVMDAAGHVRLFR